MATYYIDFEGGNDSNDGLSFANRKKSWRSADIAAGSGGPHEFRIMASPEPTNIGTGYVTSTTSCDYLEYVYGNGNINGIITLSTTEGATNIYKPDHKMVTGDTILITPVNTNTGYWTDSGNIYGTFEITRVDDDNFTLDGFTASINGAESGFRYSVLTVMSAKTIILDTAVTEPIACHGTQQRGAWTASANVTCQLQGQTSAYSSDQKGMEGYWGDSFTISSSFTTGKAAYWTLPSTLDLSGYQQLSLWWRRGSGSYETSSANGYSNFSIRLCSDTTGDTTVNTFNIPIIGASSSDFGFRPITVDLGTNLGSSIQSIALYVDTDKGAQTFYLSNIIACKAKTDDAALTLNSLVGLNTTTSATGGVPGNREWYAIESIVGRRVVLMSQVSRSTRGTYQRNGASFAWHGDNQGTRDIYKREAIFLEMPRASGGSYSTSNSDSPFFVTNAGSSSGDRVISGGWNRTDMSTQLGDEIGDDGMTYLDGGNMADWALYSSSRSYLHFKNLGFVRWRQNRFNALQYGIKLENLDCIQHWQEFYFSTSYSNYFRNIRVNCCSYSTQTQINASIIDDPSGSLTITAFGNLIPLRLASNGCFIIDRLHICGGGDSSGYFTTYGHLPVKINSFTNYPGEGGMNQSSSTGMIPPLRGSRPWNYSQEDYREVAFSRALEDVSSEFGENPGIYIGIATFINTTYCLNSQNGGGGNIEFGELHHKTTDGTQGYRRWFAYQSNSYRRTIYSQYPTGDYKIKIHKGEGFDAYMLDSGNVFLNDFEFSSSSPLTFFYFVGKFCSRNHDGVSGDIFNRVGGCEIIPDTTIRHTASGLSWKMTKKDVFDTKFKIASIPATANSQITLKLWFYRSSASAPVGRLEIVKSDTAEGTTTSYSSNTSSNGSWEELSVSTTPSYDTIVHCYVHVENFDASNNTSIYIDDFSIS